MTFQNRITEQKKTFIPKHLREISQQQLNESTDKVYDKIKFLPIL